MPEHVTLQNLLRVGRPPGSVFAWRRGAPCSYAQFERAARAWRAGFAAAPGQRFVLDFSDALDFVAALFGAWHAGKCALVPTQTQKASLAQLGFAVDGYAGDGGGGGDGDSSRGVRPGEPATQPWQDLDPEAPLFEIFTSGSTGTPVAIPKVLRQLDAELEGVATMLGVYSPDLRVLGTVSHQHMYGFVFRLMLPLLRGVAFEAQRLSRVQDLRHLPDGERCVLVSSPAHLARLPEETGRIDGAVAVLSAGGPLVQDVVRDCQAVLGVAPFEIYGSSETGAVAYRQRDARHETRWRPLPGVDTRVEDERLCLRTRALPTAEWFHSGDRVACSDDGSFELLGRADRIVKLDELRVSLDAVERLLVESGLVQRASALVLDEARPVLAVIALPTAQGWTLADGGKRALSDALGEVLRRSSQVEVLPRRWRFVDPWPVNADGKSPQSLLLERFDRRRPEFRVLATEGTQVTLEIVVAPGSPFFEGHFAGLPILPGVAQLDWMIWLSTAVFGAHAPFAGLEAVKFQRVIRPGTRLTATLAFDAAAGRTRYGIRSAEGPCASGRICWGVPA